MPGTSPTHEPICVITPCFNAEKYIADCVRSVAQQLPYVAKHIVMDGKSRDGTLSLLASLSQEYPHLVVRSEEDQGQADALQKALDLVDTPYFGWLNADDYYLDGAVAAMLSAMEPGKEPAIIYGNYIRVDSRSEVLHRRKQPSFSRWDCLHGYLTVQNSAALFRTANARKCGGFDAKFQFAMDYDFVLRLAQTGPVQHIDRYLAAFRMHPISKTSNLEEVNILEVAKIRAAYSRVPPFLFPLTHTIARGRVFLRMLREGCLSSRFESRDGAAKHVADLSATFRG